DVEIERARRPPFGARSSRRLLDVVQMLQQVSRGECGFESDHLIEIFALGQSAKRIRLLDGRFTDHLACGKRRQRGPRLLEMAPAISHVRAERDVRDVDHSGFARSTATWAYATGPASATCGFRTATRVERMRSSSDRTPAAMRSATSSRSPVCDESARAATL